MQRKQKCVDWKVSSTSILWQHYSSERLFLCSRGESVSSWDLGSSEPKCNFKVDLGDYIGFSQCDLIKLNHSSILATPGPSQEAVSVWDTNSGIQICKLLPECDSKNYGCVMQVKWIFLGASLLLLVAYENGELVLWDWPNRTLFSSLKLSDSPLSIAYNADSNMGLCGTSSEKIVSFHLENGSLHAAKDLEITNPGISCITNRPDNKLVATGGWDSRIRIFSWKKLKPLAVLDYHKESIECIQFSKYSVPSFSEGGFLLAAASTDKTVSLWDIFN